MTIQVEFNGLRYHVELDGRVHKRRGKGFIKAFPDKDGYLKYAFFSKLGTYNISVSRFVWEIHNGKIPDGMTVDHIDGDRLNNHIGNLQLLSSKSNAIKGNAKHWIVTDPDGMCYDVYNLEAFCRENNLHPGHMGAVARGFHKHHKHWSCNYV